MSQVTPFSALPGEFAISVDTREKMPWKIPKGIRSVCRKLDQGDYSVVGHEHEVAVERKSLDDYVSTVLGRDNAARWQAELERLKDYKLKFIVVEATEQQVRLHKYESKWPPSNVLASAQRLHAEHMPVMFMGDPSRCAAYAFSVMRFWFWKHHT